MFKYAESASRHGRISLPTVSSRRLLRSDEYAGRFADAGFMAAYSADVQRMTAQSSPAPSMTASAKSAHEQVPSLVQWYTP